MDAEKIADRAAVIFTGLRGYCPIAEYEERAVFLAMRLEIIAARKIAERERKRAERDSK